MSIRLGDRLPSIGDAVDGLYLQNFSVDCYDLTARLHFGHPDYLSAEDMRELLSGFRDRTYSSTAPNRDSADPSEGQVQGTQEGESVKPIAVTEFSPGTYRKLVIKPSNGASEEIKLDSSDLDGKTAKFRDVTIYDKAGHPSTLKVLATEQQDGEGGEPAEDEDPHETDDPHGSSGDPCNPGGTSDSGSGAGGAGGAGVAGTATPEPAEGGVSGGAGVNAGETPSTGSTVRGCDC